METAESFPNQERRSKVYIVTSVIETTQPEYIGAKCLTDEAAVGIIVAVEDVEEPLTRRRPLLRQKRKETLMEPLDESVKGESETSVSLKFHIQK